MRGLNSLTVVDFDESSFGQHGLECLAHCCPGMTHLRFIMPTLSLQHIGGLATMTRLRALDLSCFSASDANRVPADAQVLAPLTAMTQLHLGVRTRPPTDWAFLSGMASLQDLEIWDICIGTEAVALDRGLGTVLSGLPSLERLAVSAADATVAQHNTPNAVAHCGGWSLPALRTLVVGKDQDVRTAAALAARCPRLQQLDLGRNFLVLQARSGDAPEHVALSLHALRALNQRGFITSKSILLARDFSADMGVMEQASRICAALHAANDDAVAAGGLVLPELGWLVLKEAASDAHFEWLLRLAPDVHTVSCEFRWLPLLSELVEYGRLQAVILLDFNDERPPLSEVCTVLGSLRVRPGAALRVHNCAIVLSIAQLTLAAHSFASQGLCLLP